MRGVGSLLNISPARAYPRNGGFEQDRKNIAKDWERVLGKPSPVSHDLGPPGEIEVEETAIDDLTPTERAQLEAMMAASRDGSKPASGESMLDTIIIGKK